MARVLAVLGVAAWCFFILLASLGMIVDRGLADVGIVWVGVLGIGIGGPAILLWQINRAITTHEASRRSLPDERDKEKEILGAIEKRGEISPVTAAISTSLTADEASKMLEKLTTKGYLQLRVENGPQTYVLTGQDTRELPRPSLMPADRPEIDARDSSPADLSERELEVLALLASGRTNSEIAGDLFVAVGTVKSHVNNIYNKLEVKNRTEAVTRARELELLR